MADDNWVADVRRWVNSGSGVSVKARDGLAPATDDHTDIGYEAAHPALQAAHWPDAARAAASQPA